MHAIDPERALRRAARCFNLVIRLTRLRVVGSSQGGRFLTGLLQFVLSLVPELDVPTLGTRPVSDGFSRMEAARTICWKSGGRTESRADVSVSAVFNSFQHASIASLTCLSALSLSSAVAASLTGFWIFSLFAQSTDCIKLWPRLPTVRRVRAVTSGRWDVS
jgi:hypothetical protein